MLLPSYKYVLEEYGNKVIFKRIEELNNFFTKAFSAGVVFLGAGAFALIHITFEGRLFYYCVFGSVIVLLGAIGKFMVDGSPPVPFMVFNKKRKQIKIHNGFDVPYERVKCLKVRVWMDSNTDSIPNPYCDIKLFTNDGPKVFEMTFDANKTNWKVLADVLKKEINVEFKDES